MARLSAVKKLYQLSERFTPSKHREAIKLFQTLNRRRTPLRDEEKHLLEEALRNMRLALLLKGKEDEFLRISEYKKLLENA